MILLEGRTRHRRLSPRPHPFAYPVVYAACRVLPPSDTDGVAARAGEDVYRLGGLLAVRARDHLPLALAGDDTDSPLDLHARLCRLLEFQAADVAGAWLVTMPRWCGYAFNPVSVFYVFGAAEKAKATGKSDKGASSSSANAKNACDWLCAVLEVHNTFGERHPYLLWTRDGRRSNRPKYAQILICDLFDERLFSDIHVVSICNGPCSGSFTCRRSTIGAGGTKFI